VSDNRTTVGGREVVVATNDQATRAGIRMALASDGFDVTAEPASADELMTAIERKRPDACIVDIDLPGDGLRAVGVLATRTPSTVVVVLANDENEAQFLEAMRLGASGYLAKAIAPASLATALHAALQGEPAVPRSLVSLLINEFRDRPVRRYLAVRGDRGLELTAREWEVLELMQEGLSTREISERLLISDVTVRRHIAAAVKKLDADSRAGALKLLQSA
jgi:DNA-binding NarL/FixJ family response regulator